MDSFPSTLLAQKRVVVGVTGGIAAYKSAELVRHLKKHGAEVRVVMTKAAKAFITPMTMQALSGHPVHASLFDLTLENAMGHIQLARWADCLVVAPASADFIAKLAQGQANDLLSTVCLATQAPIAVVPAMNQQMWNNAFVQNNIKLLENNHIQIWGPDAGEQACGEIGFGRMLEPAEILQSVVNLFDNKRLNGLRIMVTAGPTEEAIDPVRYLTNRSSGKMGYAIAQAAGEWGAQVSLVSGPSNLPIPSRLSAYFKVNSALEMLDTVMTHIREIDIFISVAAVADYRPRTTSLQKIAKTEDILSLELIKNPDIVAEVASLPQKPFVVGFAAETDNVLDNAHAKREKKQLDMIVANQVGLQDQGFGVDLNALTVICAHGEQVLPLASKRQLAKDLLSIIKDRYEQYEKNST